MDLSVGVPFQTTLPFWCSLGAMVVVAGLMLVSRYASPQVAHRVTMACGVLLAIAAAGVVSFAPLVALTLLGLALLSVVVWIAGSDRAKRAVAWLLSPRLVWPAALGILLLVARLTAWQPIPEMELASQPGSSVQSEPIVGMSALSDRGRAIRLVRYTEGHELPQLESDLLRDRAYENQVIRLAGPNPACNCHGWVFAGGQYGIPGSEVFPLLADNDYRRVDQPQPGDLIVYSRRGEATHTGLVRLVDDSGLVLIESKWGPLGVYLHGIHAQPFGRDYAFHRSPRAGHLIQLDPASSSEEALEASATARIRLRRAGPMGVKSAKIRTPQS